MKDFVSVGNRSTCSDAARESLETGLRGLMPWRKGPFHLHGIHIDTEWRSDWKWNRLLPHISPLAGRSVLDIGCGNGYHCFRAVGEGARAAWGVDPNILFHLQFEAIKQLLGPVPAWHLPLGIEALPEGARIFDTVFSMGVLYHRKNPVEHLERLRTLARPGGEIVVETLVVEGDDSACLVPEGRYAQMRNVWFIPSPVLLKRLLRRSGLRNARIVSVSPTTVEEQRSTDWMIFHSLSDFLDPENPTRTREGYPAPVRAIAVADA